MNGPNASTLRSTRRSEWRTSFWYAFIICHLPTEERHSKRHSMRNRTVGRRRLRPISSDRSDHQAQSMALFRVSLMSLDGHWTTLENPSVRPKSAGRPGGWTHWIHWGNDYVAEESLGCGTDDVTLTDRCNPPAIKCTASAFHRQSTHLSYYWPGGHWSGLYLITSELRRWIGCQLFTSRMPLTHSLLAWTNKRRMKIATRLG